MSNINTELSLQLTNEYLREAFFTSNIFYKIMTENHTGLNFWTATVAHLLTQQLTNTLYHIL